MSDPKKIPDPFAEINSKKTTIVNPFANSDFKPKATNVSSASEPKVNPFANGITLPKSKTTSKVRDN